MERKKLKSRSHGKRKDCNDGRKIRAEESVSASLTDLSIALKCHGQHGLFFNFKFLAYLGFAWHGVGGWWALRWSGLVV